MDTRGGQHLAAELVGEAVATAMALAFQLLIAATAVQSTTSVATGGTRPTLIIK